MIRALPFLSVGASTFAAALALLAWLALHGFVGAETIELAGRSIATHDGAVTLREIALAFPPAPYLLSVGLQWIAPGNEIPVPNILSALAFAGLTIAILRSFFVAGYRLATALAMTGMLVGNPAFLHLASTGPSPVLLAFGAWLVATTAYRLRARANIVDLMGFSFCLAFLALCHPLGAMMALGLTPFLILILPPQVTSESTVGAYLTVLFPCLLVMGGALYVSWIFTGDAFSLVRTLSARSGDLGFEQAGAPTNLRKPEAAWAWALYLLLTGLNAPILLGGMRFMHRRLPRLMPMLAFTLCVPLAAVMGDALGLGSAPVLLVAPLVGIAAASAAIFPIEEQRPVLALLLVAAGVVGGAFTLRIAAGAETHAWIAAMTGQKVVANSEPERAVGSALIGRSDVLIDIVSTPAVVTGRKSAKGLVGPLNPAFEIARMAQRPTSRYLAVRNVGGFHRESDGVHAIFPKLYADGMPGYVRIYDHLGWRVYERTSSALAWK